MAPLPSLVQAYILSFLGHRHAAFSDLIKTPEALSIGLGGRSLCIHEVETFLDQFRDTLLEDWLASGLHRLKTLEVALKPESHQCVRSWTFVETLINNVIERAEQPLALSVVCSAKGLRWRSLRTPSLTKRSLSLTFSVFNWHAPVEAPDLFNQIIMQKSRVRMLGLPWSSPLMRLSSPPVHTLYTDQIGLMGDVRELARYAQYHKATVIVPEISGLRDLFVLWWATQQKVARCQVEILTLKLPFRASGVPPHIASASMHVSQSVYYPDSSSDPVDGSWYMHQLLHQPG